MFKKKLFDIIKSESPLNVKYESFEFSDYHKYVKSDLIHNKIINKTRELRLKHLPLEILENISKCASASLKKRLSFFYPSIKDEIIILRISRPKSLDINPPHRDGYLEKWKKILNI